MSSINKMVEKDLNIHSRPKRAIHFKSNIVSTELLEHVNSILPMSSSDDEEYCVPCEVEDTLNTSDDSSSEDDQEEEKQVEEVKEIVKLKKSLVKNKVKSLKKKTKQKKLNKSQLEDEETTNKLIKFLKTKNKNIDIKQKLNKKLNQHSTPSMMGPFIKQINNTNGDEPLIVMKHYMVCEPNEPNINDINDEINNNYHKKLIKKEKQPIIKDTNSEWKCSLCGLKSNDETERLGPLFGPYRVTNDYSKDLVYNHDIIDIKPDIKLEKTEIGN
jgi:hypothetical protein